MTTVVTPPTPISTLPDAVSFLTDVRNDIPLSLSDTQFSIELLGKSYSVRIPFAFEQPRKAWYVDVDDGGQWPDRSGRSLGYKWEWEYAIDIVISDVERFYPSPNVIDSGLYLWLDASVCDTVVIADGTTDEVEKWNDMSGNGFNTDAQSVSANRPRLVEADQNGLNTISFDGVAQHLILPIDSFKDWTAFVVAKRQTSTSDRGTFISAMGLEPTFSGLDTYVLQNGNLGTEGVLQTYADGFGFVSTSSPLAADVYEVLEWGQEAKKVGTSDAGIDGGIEVLIDCEDTSDDNFDTTRQSFTEPTPVTGAIGYTQAGINPGFEFNYLEGSIGEIVVYNRLLSSSERLTVRNGLIAKWQT